MDPALESFLDYSVVKLRQNTEKISNSLALVTHDQLWFRHSEQENSIANLILHLSGNIRQWILTGLDGQPDTRQRDAEFAARRAHNAHDAQDAADLLALLRASVDQVATVIQTRNAAQLAAYYGIQGYRTTGIAAIYHVVEHFSYHTGQILFAVKQFTHKDLGFYNYLGEKSLHEESIP